MRTQYLYDDVTGACIAEFDENGDTQVEYTTNPQTGELISENHNGQEVYHRYDGEGNTRQTTDSDGSLLGEATYTAFGETVAESGDMMTTYRFRGQRGHTTDVVTGDISKSSQVYSPSLGRKLSLANAGMVEVATGADVSQYSVSGRTSSIVAGLDSLGQQECSCDFYSCASRVALIAEHMFIVLTLNCGTEIESRGYRGGPTGEGQASPWLSAMRAVGKSEYVLGRCALRRSSPTRI